MDDVVAWKKDTEKYLDKFGITKLIKLFKFGHRRIWHGTQAKWDALSDEERDKYDHADIKEERQSIIAATSEDLNEIRTRVTACETKDTAQDTAIAGNTANITTNATDISGLKTRMTAAETKNTQQDASIGNLASLTTTAKTSLVAAVNEVDADVGNLAYLKTVDKTSLVNAVSEASMCSDKFVHNTYTGTVTQNGQGYFVFSLSVAAPLTGMYIMTTSGRASVTNGSVYRVGSTFCSLTGSAQTCTNSSVGGATEAPLGTSSIAYFTTGQLCSVNYMVEGGNAPELNVSFNLYMVRIGG